MAALLPTHALTSSAISGQVSTTAVSVRRQ